MLRLFLIDKKRYYFTIMLFAKPWKIMEAIEPKTTTTPQTFKDVADSNWKDLCDAASIIMNKVFISARKNYSQEIYQSAREQFFFKAKDQPNIFLDTDDKEFLGLLENSFFIPWYLFNYNVNTEGGFETIASKFFNVDEITSEEQFLTKYQETVFIALHDAHYSLLEVIETEPGKTITFKDVLLDKTVIVKEYAGSKSAQIGSLFYGKILTVEDSSILVTSCNFTIGDATRQKMLPLLQEIRAKVAVSPNPIHALKTPSNDDALRNLFFAWALSQAKEEVTF